MTVEAKKVIQKEIDYYINLIKTEKPCSEREEAYSQEIERLLDAMKELTDVEQREIEKKGLRLCIGNH